MAPEKRTSSFINKLFLTPNAKSQIITANDTISQGIMCSNDRTIKLLAIIANPPGMLWVTMFSFILSLCLNFFLSLCHVQTVSVNFINQADFSYQDYCSYCSSALPALFVRTGRGFYNISFNTFHFVSILISLSLQTASIN